VYKAYQGPPHFWSRAMVDHTLFSRRNLHLSSREKAFDGESIIAWPMPSKFTSWDFEIDRI
jgi:hypothetical protein